MTEEDLLKALEYYELRKGNLKESILADPEKTMEKISVSSNYNPEYFSDEVIDILISLFDSNPSRTFHILQNLASKLPEKAEMLMKHYYNHFEKYPKESNADFYYVSANHPEFVTSEFVDILLKNMQVDPFNCIMIFQQWLYKKPELINEIIVEAVLDNIGKGANQAFYFLRDVSKKFSHLTPLCTLGLFECVIKEHHYYVKREMMRDIVIIATMSHIKRSLEIELQNPLIKGTKVARALMAIIFRQKFRVQQSVLLEALDFSANWVVPWDFFIMLLEISDEQHVSTSLAERFLDGIYRLGFLLNSGQFEKIIVKKLELSDIHDESFPEDIAFLNQTELISIYSKAKELTSRLETNLIIKPIDNYKIRIQNAEEQLYSIQEILRKNSSSKKEQLEIRVDNLKKRIDSWKKGILNRKEMDRLKKDVKNALAKEISEISLELIEKIKNEAVEEKLKRIFGTKYDIEQLSDKIYPALFLLEKLGRGKNYQYLSRLIEDKLEKKQHNWLWTEPPVKLWMDQVKDSIPEIEFNHWRAPFTIEYAYTVENATKEKKRRVQIELKQTSQLFEKLEIEIEVNSTFGDLKKKLNEVPSDADSETVQEIQENLERIRRILITPDSDYEGIIELSVETDPFQYLFMGEFGFASCLSMRGAYFWSAVSNAIDIDKVVIWAKESSINIVGRRLIALTPKGVVSYRTYANRHGLALDKFFTDFIKKYAEHCGTKYVKQARVSPLLSDDWYDDQTI